MAAASPLGVIGGPVPLGIASGNGTGFPAIFIISTIIVLLFAVGFTALTPHVPNAGAFYSYISHGLGRALGVAAAFVALPAYAMMQIGLFGLFGVVTSGVLDSLGIKAPWVACALVAWALVAVLGQLWVDLSGKVLGVENAANANGARALQWSDTGTADHRWRLRHGRDGCFRLQCGNGGRVLGVTGGSTAAGAQAVIWDDTGADDHLWRFR